MGFRLVVLAALALAGCATPHRDALHEFEVALTSQRSATETLTQWCAAHRIADPPVIRAVAVAGAPPAPSKEVLVVLDIPAQADLGFRHVRLTCGDTVLSEARNWYVPGRLPADINRALETSEVPFGRAVAPLGVVRDQRPAVRGSGNFCPQGAVLSQQAVLSLPDGRPVSVVTECYTPAVLSDQ